MMNLSVDLQKFLKTLILLILFIVLSLLAS